MLKKWLSNHVKPNSIPFLVLMTVMGALPAGDITDHHHNETIQKTAHFENTSYAGNSLNVYNIHGNLSVEEHSGDAVEIIAEKEISADRQADLERGITEMKLEVDELGNRILIYLDAPFVHHKKRDDGISYNINTSRDEIGYEFVFNISVKVPQNTNVFASTINGDVRMGNINSRDIVAKSVNGNIDLTDISGKSIATTVNGNIKVSHSKSPSEDTRYKTVNGTIEAVYPADLSADIRFSSLHGHLYTDFSNVQRTPSQVETNVNQSNGTRYRVNSSSPFRIGNGGSELHFNVLNGNVYIKKLEI